MSSRLERVVVSIFVIGMCAGSEPVFASGQVPTPANGQSTLTLNIQSIPQKKKDRPYAFSLCLGRELLPDELASQCKPSDVAKSKTVSGAMQNLPVVFRLEGTSFLPPGFTLDGFGVIHGTADADPRALKNVRLCAIQVGPIGTNFAPKCKAVAVRGGKAVIGGGASGAKVAGAIGAGVGGALAGVYLGNALGKVDSGTDDTTNNNNNNTVSRFNGTYRAVGTGSCTKGSGITPCASVFGASGCPVGTGGVITFTFTVSGGIVSDPCGWLSGTVSTSGAFNGRYFGTGANFVTVNGTLTTSTSQLTGTVVESTNTYSANLNVTKQ